MYEVLLCRGSDCRKRSQDQARIRAALPEDCVVKGVGCQKVCKGPVVGCDVAGELRWFQKVRSAKAVDALADLSRGERVRGSLRKREVKKRRGKLRGKIGKR